MVAPRGGEHSGGRLPGAGRGVVGADGALVWQPPDDPERVVLAVPLMADNRVHLGTMLVVHPVLDMKQDLEATRRGIAASVLSFVAVTWILGLALGATTRKLSFGHHGGNHPVLDKTTGKVEITSQNHSYAVDPSSLPDSVVAPLDLVRVTAVSRMVVPAARVRRNASSSAYAIALIRPKPDSSSG